MKESSIKLSDYFALVKPTYRYIQIVPHKSIRNYNSSNIAKAIAHTYKSINRRIYKSQKKLFFETSFKISYVIDISNNDTNFYFLVPEPFLNVLVEKIKEIWTKATINVLEEGIKPFSSTAELYQLSYKKEDALSLQVDKKSNEPLNSILSVMDIMKDGDRVTIVYNFMPSSQLGWLDRYTETMNRIKDKKSIEKKQLSFEYIMKNSLNILVSTLDSVVQVVNDLSGGNTNDTKESLFQSILGVLEQQKDLSAATKRKKEQTILPTQIAIISDSIDVTRAENNALGVAQSFRVLDEDNELMYKKLKNKPIDLEKYDLGCEKNYFSTDEISNFIQVPGRTLLNYFGINHIKVEENNIPLELREGIKRLGAAKFKGNKINAFLENDYNNGNLPLVLIGSQGGGKTTFMANYSKDCVDNKESLIVLDFIKNCELSEDIKRVVPKNRLIEIDLGQANSIQGLGYNEIKVTSDMQPFDKLNLANLQSQQIMALIDSISIGEPLSSRMRRFLNAAANVVFSQGYSSIREVLNCLEDFKDRENYIKAIEPNMKELLKDEIRALEELDEWSKPTKDNPTQKIGTRESKIEHILDRISMLREDFKIKFMYNKALDKNINLVESMDQGKVILIKMKEGDFPTKMQKNILVTYLISKIWLATQLRGMKHKKPIRCNVLVDEVFQAPTSMTTLEYILPQSRKFGTKFVFSTQYIKQLDSIFNTLEASGSSFMLLTGSTENDFNHFKSKIETFEYEDLRDMEKYSSLNLVKYSQGYSSFITKLPSPI